MIDPFSTRAAGSAPYTYNMLILLTLIEPQSQSENIIRTKACALTPVTA
jgi:hypothetical protein